MLFVTERRAKKTSTNSRQLRPIRHGGPWARHPRLSLL